MLSACKFASARFFTAEGSLFALDMLCAPTRTKTLWLKNYNCFLSLCDDQRVSSSAPRHYWRVRKIKFVLVVAQFAVLRRSLSREWYKVYRCTNGLFILDIYVLLISRLVSHVLFYWRSRYSNNNKMWVIPMEIKYEWLGMDSAEGIWCTTRCQWQTSSSVWASPVWIPDISIGLVERGWRSSAWQIASDRGYLPECI